MPCKDLFQLHKAALQPLLFPKDTQYTNDQFKKLESFDLQVFVEFLRRQGLSQLWREFLVKQKAIPIAFEKIVSDLQQDALGITAKVLLQRKVLNDLRVAFDQTGVEYLVFKGAHLRDTLYSNATHRPIRDIDILVRDERKFDAVKSLLQAGFSAHHVSKNISHETSLNKHGVWIDLHWRLMRPGRTRIDLNDYLFSQRQLFGPFTGLSFEASLLVMLIHPAITKYVNGTARLVLMVDIHRLLQIDQIDRERLLELLGDSGMRTAAWASLTWLQMLSDQSTHRALASQIKPGSLKSRCLCYWLSNDQDRKMDKLISRGLFSLALQDTFGDAVRAITKLQSARKNAKQQMKDFESLSPPAAKD